MSRYNSQEPQIPQAVLTRSYLAGVFDEFIPHETWKNTLSFHTGVCYAKNSQGVIAYSHPEMAMVGLIII